MYERITATAARAEVERKTAVTIPCTRATSATGRSPKGVRPMGLYHLWRAYSSQGRGCGALYTTFLRVGSFKGHGCVPVSNVERPSQHAAHAQDKTIFWCCYTCMERSLSGAEILEVIPATPGSNRPGSKPHETAPPPIPSSMGWCQRLARTPPPVPLPHRLGLDPTNPFRPITPYPFAA